MPSRDPYGHKGPSLNEMLLSSQTTVQKTNQQANNFKGINKKNTPKYENVSSSFNSSNAVPNDSHIMQNRRSLASSATKISARSFSSQRQRSPSAFGVQRSAFNSAQSKYKLPFCKNCQIAFLSESNLKCVEHYIRNEASQMIGFQAKSFNMRSNDKYKNHECYVNFATAEQANQASELFNNVRKHGCQLTSKFREPVKDKNEIKPVKVRSYHIISIYF